MKYFHTWQESPRQTGYSGWFRVWTNHKEIAKNLRQRKRCEENQVIGTDDCLFAIQFLNKEKALNSFNTMLKRHSFPKLKYNAKNEEYSSNMPPNIVPNTKARYKNAK
ncbi:hypothetical protein N8720_04405 [Candidatus Marinimicrobia bacterium]|jgi:hypothetical protein|nr:hypothetical protein [Candidatus Neomarinimicrobiota bacterium]|tara:strand:+ start:4864 stop:5187 length:324 start_codon:yes stop_codon:yes gene_type:complete